MNLKIKYFLLLIFTVFIGFVQAQTKSINTSNIDFRFADGKIFITYDIVNSAPNELYTITVSVFRENGGKLNAVSLSGDLIEIKGGTGKTIIWEQRKDGYVLDEKIYISLAIAPKVIIPIATHLLKSVVYPGWGDYKIRNGKYHFLYGVAGLSAIGASIYMNSQAQKNYTNYKNSFDYSKSNSLFDKAKQQQNLSYIFAGTACLVWTIDLACLYGKTNKVRKQITKENSKYYFEKSQQTNSFSSSLNAINTKVPYDLAMERGDKLLADYKLPEAKIAFEEGQKYENTETVRNKLVSINKLIDEEKNKKFTYDSNITKGQELMALKQFKEAIVAFESASRLKPNEKYPTDKIFECNQELNKIENQKLYDAQMVQGIAHLGNGDFETANTFFKRALTYKENDITALNQCKLCVNGIAFNEQKRVDSEYKQKMTQANSSFNLKKYEDAKEKYTEAKELKPDNLEVQSKIDLCDFNIRFDIAKNESDVDNKITLLENLKSDYPSKSTQLVNLINETRKHKQIRIPLTKRGNSHTIKAKINNVLSFDFILDTGADNVLVAPDVFITFYKAGLITEGDIIGKQHFSIADGSTVKGLKFYLREIQIGEIILNNVEASVIAGGDYDMLLGGSVFRKIGKITIDYANHELIIEK